jgi:threonine dehydrogenase-like Zn-dependent dehydrogenase
VAWTGSRGLQAGAVTIHRFRLDDILEAYETFFHATDKGVLKVFTGI